MGTRADFYIGRGVDAEWIGSIAYDGYPDGIDKQVLGCQSEDSFRHAVIAFLAPRDDKTFPADGWPWPWMTSSTTDYAYAIDAGHVYASCFGGPWFQCETPEAQRPYDSEGTRAAFPDMTAFKQRAKFGAHSGIMLLSSGGHSDE